LLLWPSLFSLLTSTHLSLPCSIPSHYCSQGRAICLLSIRQTKKDSFIKFLTYFVFKLGDVCVLSLYYLLTVSICKFSLFFPSQGRFWSGGKRCMNKIKLFFIKKTLLLPFNIYIIQFSKIYYSFFSLSLSNSFPIHKRPQKTDYNSIFHTFYRVRISSSLTFLLFSCPSFKFLNPLIIGFI